jgi:hypothetical protein
VERGDVHLVEIELPDRNNPGRTVKRDKYLVLLRGGPHAAGETDVPYVIASTDSRTPGTRLRSFEVLVGTADGFQHDTLIDCRWVYTRLASDLTAASRRFRLPLPAMDRVSVALVSGLHMHPKFLVAHTVP